MQIAFVKYQGAGNDFVLCDDRQGSIQPLLDTEKIARLCDRRFGIGADGLMLLRSAGQEFDFEMDYYNSDGNRSSMCGNGGRCIVRFAGDLGIERKLYRFLAADGPHEASLLADGSVSLGMTKVTEITDADGSLILDTGSPHYIKFVDDLQSIDVRQEGRSIRRSAPFASKGINVNFVEKTDRGLRIGTYERGVEDETLACGTGVTAAVIAHLHRHHGNDQADFTIAVSAKGGELSVSGRKVNGSYTNLRLTGPAVRVFSGTINI